MSLPLGQSCTVSNDHIRKSDESNRQSLFLKNLDFTRTKSKKKNLQLIKPKVTYIIGGKTLLTVKLI